MARRRRKKSSKKHTPKPQRELQQIADPTRSLWRPNRELRNVRFNQRPEPLRDIIKRTFEPLLERQDKRRFRPEQSPPPDLYREPRVIDPPASRPQDTWMRYEDPKRVTVCRRRQRRRQFLFASQKAGKGIRAPKRRVFTPDSRISCKRRR